MNKEHLLNELCFSTCFRSWDGTPGWQGNTVHYVPQYTTSNSGQKYALWFHHNFSKPVQFLQYWKCCWYYSDLESVPAFTLTLTGNKTQWWCYGESHTQIRWMQRILPRTRDSVWCPAQPHLRHQPSFTIRVGVRLLVYQVWQGPSGGYIPLPPPPDDAWCIWIHYS